MEGTTDAARAASIDAALGAIGLPAIVRPAFTLGGTGGGIVETEADYRERVRSGLRASPIGQVMVEKCLVGWQEIEYEVMRDADDTCIAVCSMENVDPLGVHTGDSIVVAPVQTLPDAVHQRLRSAALAIIRGLGVEGGCNVQFALSPDSRDYAVIEVNPRVSRSSALASKATGYPIARVAAQIAVGRRLAEIPNVVTGTTVAAFEPALDYLVVKLPRFPFDKFPRADRSLGSQMKATGEVMAIDRTFGAALNKALRGLEQAGAGPLAEDPAWAPTLDYLGAALGGDPDEAEAVIRWIDEDGEACESTRLAQRSAAPIVLRRFLAPSDNRLWRLMALLRRGVAEATLVEATGINSWFVAELGRSVALERRIRAAGAALVDPANAASATLLATAKRAALGDREIADLAGVGEGDVAAARAALGLAPGFAMVDTCAAEFAAETPYFYSTLRGRRLAARGAAGRATRGARHRLRARADRAGDRVRLLRGARRREPARPGLGGGPGELQPGDGLHRLRRQQPALLRAPRRGERPRDRGRRDARRRRPSAGLRPVRRPDAAQPGDPPGRRGRPAPGGVPRDDRPGRGPGPLLRPRGPDRASRSRRAGWPAPSTRPRRSPSASATR